jgi:hypothetical protein
VVPHVLASCAPFCDTSAPQVTTPWWTWAILAFIGLIVLGGLANKLSENIERRKRGLPPEPMTDMSPGMASLLSGRNVPAYTAKVDAVTPGGVRVRQSRCCPRGHQSPAQAVAHASAIKRRIETTGR